MISPIGSESLTWYPVSTLVNNVKNKTHQNIVKIDPRLVEMELLVVEEEEED